ncbi:hypothetical protein JW859_00055 [bacterium]|nr:hypothetical protein [bacterium]
MRAGLIGLIGVLLLVAGCPRTANEHAPEAGRTDHQSKNPASSMPLAGKAGAGESEILLALDSDMPDEQRFAMLIIERYQLDGFADKLRELSAADPVAAMLLASNYGETAAIEDYFAAQPPGQRVGAILGAAFGLACAYRVPPDLWANLLERTADAEQRELLWGLGQLDLEPGGPLGRNEHLTEVWQELKATAGDDADRYTLGALDALLGSVNQPVDWDLYIEYAPESHWNSTQWAALLRWAPAQTWLDVLDAVKNNSIILHEMSRAVAISAPPGVYLPGSDAQLITDGLGLENRVVKFINTKVDTMDLPELEELFSDPEVPHSEDVPEDVYRQQALKLALGEVMVMLDYAVIRHDETLIARVIDSVPQMTEVQIDGVLATIMRRNPQVLTDDQIAALAALDDRAVSYFLLQGWYDRPAVQQSHASALVGTSPSHENALLFEGYHRWLDSQ